MIVDASAVLAILLDEPEAPGFAAAIAAADQSSISPVNYLEAAIVIDRARDPVVSRRFDQFIETAGISIAAIDDTQARIARAAYRDFGRGSAHPARLNLGDCFAYALSRSLGEPLLYKGNDFLHTDVTPAALP